MQNCEELVGSAVRPAPPPQANAVLVALANDMAGVQGPDGTMVPADRLGVGVVRGVGPRGDVQVYWVEAAIDAWVVADDLRPLGPGWRLVTVRQPVRQDRPPPSHSFPAQLDHHWTVELLPRGVIRAVRADGPCWTFTVNPMSHEVEPPWDTQLDDDGAEAVVAADLAVARLQPGRGLVAALVRHVAERVPRPHIPWPFTDSHSRN